MNEEDPQVMRSLEARLAKMHAGLDTRPGFEDRLQQRIAALAAARHPPATAESRQRLEREYQRARAAVNHAARLDELALAIAGLGGVAAVWRLAPELGRWYAASVGHVEPAVLAIATLSLAGAALWALLRQFGVNPRSLVGT